MERRVPQRRTSALDGVDDGRMSVSRDATRDRRPIRALIVTLVLLAILLVIALVGFIVLANTPAFTISSIDAQDTEHLTAENIAKLASIEEGTTLLTIDERVVTENLQRNPWVGSVTFVREFPDRLKIEVTERRVDCLVKMSTGSVCWCLGDDNVWIEPINLTVLDGQSAEDVSLSLAQDMGAILINDVPTSMSPSAGSAANDEVLKAISLYREQFSDTLSSQIVKFSAASVESLSCTLSSGVEVSLGAPTNIELKETVLLQILEQHPNQITYVNVRVPSQPSYRKLGVDAVAPGTGVTVDLGSTTGAPGAQDATGDAAAGEDDPLAEGGSAEGTAMPTGDGTTSAEGAEGTDTSELILGGDGNYYTYEEYWGIEG